MLITLRGLAALVLVFAMCAAAQADVRDEFEPSGKIWTVDKDGGGDFETISEAIEAAADGDGIRVHPGVYREALSIEKELYIESADRDRDDVVIETENNPCVYFAAERGAVRGMTLRNSGYQEHACVHIVSGELLLADNDVRSKISDGVRILGKDTSPTVISNRIYENKASGVYVLAAAKGRFENNEIFGNELPGVYVTKRAAPVFTGNRIHGNKKAGFYITEGAKGRFENNEIFGNTNNSVQVTRGANPLFTGNRIFDGKSGGVSVYENGKGRFENNEIYDNTFSGAYVEGPAEPVFTGNRIHGNKKAGFYMTEGAKGRFENNEVFGDTNNSVQVTRGADPLFIGNRIFDGKSAGISVYENGKGRFENNEIYDNTFSGVIVEDAEPVFTGNRIYGNKEDGVWVFAAAKGRFENNEIYGNTFSGVSVKERAEPVFTGNRIYENKDGGVTVSDNAKGRFENNEIFNNEKSGAAVLDHADAVFTGNRIYENKTFGFLAAAAKGRFENNEIFGNELPGVYVTKRAAPVFTGNRIHSNKKSGLHITDGAKGRFENNEIYKNGLSGVYVAERANPVFINNRVYDNKEHGIAVMQGGKGRYENNEISGNKKEQFIGPEETQSLPPAMAAIGVIYVRRDSEDGHHCTAFLTGPDTIVTAAHCVTTYSGDVLDIGSIKFHDISKHGLPPADAAKFLHVGSFAAYSTSANTFSGYMSPMGKDIAVIQISEPLGDTLGWLRKGKVDWDEIAGGGEYEIIGAPRGRLIREKPCVLHPDVTRMWEGISSSVHKAFKIGAFFHTCATPPGYSGGPVLREDNGEITWIGVNSATVTLRWTGYPPVEDVGTAMLLQPGGGFITDE